MGWLTYGLYFISEFSYNTHGLICCTFLYFELICFLFVWRVWVWEVSVGMRLLCLKLKLQQDAKETWMRQFWFQIPHQSPPHRLPLSLLQSGHRLTRRSTSATSGGRHLYILPPNVVTSSKPRSSSRLGRLSTSQTTLVCRTQRENRQSFVLLLLLSLSFSSFRCLWHKFSYRSCIVHVSSPFLFFFIVFLLDLHSLFRKCYCREYAIIMSELHFDRNWNKCWFNILGPYIVMNVCLMFFSLYICKKKHHFKE